MVNFDLPGILCASNSGSGASIASARQTGGHLQPGGKGTIEEYVLDILDRKLNMFDLSSARWT